MVPIIPLKPLFQKTISTIIAPHGITDIMHAKQYNLTTELIQINGFGLVYSHILHFTSPDIILHSVLFPDPLFPPSSTTSPLFILRLMS